MNGRCGNSAVCRIIAHIPLTISSLRAGFLRSPEVSLSGTNHVGRDHQYLFHLGEFGTELDLHVLEHPTVFHINSYDSSNRLTFRKYAIKTRGNDGIPYSNIAPTLNVFEGTSSFHR